MLAAIAYTLLTAGAVTAETTYTIDIGGPLDELFVKDGWYGPEGPYEQFGGIWESRCRWSTRGAEVRLPVFPSVANTVQVRAMAGGGDGQKVRFSANGELLAEFDPRDDLLYEFEIRRDVVGDTGWVVLGIEAEKQGPASTGDSRDLRVAVDWIKVTGDGEARDYIGEVIGDEARHLALLAHDEPPKWWRMRYDPNSVGDRYAPTKFHTLMYDDSQFETVPTAHVPPMRRGDACWYRAWVLVGTKLHEVRKRLKLPGDRHERDGRRIVWVNSERLDGADGDLEARVAEKLVAGPNVIVVKIMQGPLSKASGDNIIERPEFTSTRTLGKVRLVCDALVLTGDHANAGALTATLIAPSGETVGSVRGTVVDLGAGKRGVTAGVTWDLDEYGAYQFIVTEGAKHEQRFPVHMLGLHFFHWGWYSAGGGTTWRGFEPCSNDYLDELLKRVGERGRPHHSISWGGAILAPNTGFHRTGARPADEGGERVDYIAQLREAFADGDMEFVGMPYPPRNICGDFGESLLRSMRYSRKLYESQLGQTPTRFYSHDATMTPLMPQVMQMAGYDTYCIAENWWGQGRSVPNSLDCYFRNADGTEVRVLDSWYHGVSPVVAARRAAEQGKRAVLCNEEFACLDRTTFLEDEHLETLASEGIFLKPVSLNEYQELTDDIAREHVYEGDDALCYKGWVGGGPGEAAYENVNRLLETRLVALENVAAFARSRGVYVPQPPIDEMWDRSLRWHECHSHWGNGNEDATDRMAQDAVEAAAGMVRLTRHLADDVGGKGGVVVLNPVGRLMAPEGSVALVRGKEAHALQVDPDEPDLLMASLPGLPSVGYRAYEYAKSAPAPGDVTAIISQKTARLDNGLIRVIVDGDGSLSIVDVETGEELVCGANALHVALPKGEHPKASVSTELEPLNVDYYDTPTTIHPREICEGPVMAAVECEPELGSQPNVKVNIRVSLIDGERQARIRLRLVFDEPTELSVGGRGPHEGTYLPGLFVRFPFEAGAKPVADMAYCTTDSVLTSTNHETFMKLPFRSGTFNALSLAGPNSGAYAVLTRGLPDFFVTRPPSAPPGSKLDVDEFMGLSLGVGAANTPYSGIYVHEYAVLAPARPHEAFLAARGYLVDPIAVLWKGGEGDLPTEGSFIEASGDGVMVAGVQLGDDALTARVVNLKDSPVAARVRCMEDLDGADVSPSGELRGETLNLGPKAVREIRAPH